MVYSMMMALNVGLLYAFIIEGPFLLIDLFAVATQQYGYYQLLIVGMYAIGSYLASQLVKRMSPQRLLSLSLIAAGRGGP